MFDERNPNAVNVTSAKQQSLSFVNHEGSVVVGTLEPLATDPHDARDSQHAYTS